MFWVSKLARMLGIYREAGAARIMRHAEEDKGARIFLIANHLASVLHAIGRCPRSRLGYID